MSKDQELMHMAGRHTDNDTAADLPAVVNHPTSFGDVDLTTNPFEDDLADKLQARSPWRTTPRTTLALGGLVLVVGGFLAGVLVESNFGASATSTVQANGPGGFGGAGLGGGGFGGGPGGAGQASTGPGQTAADTTTGTVKLVDGTTVYLTTADGQVVTVKTSATTTVTLEQPGALTDLIAGATVTVAGTTGTDGVITATHVTAEK